MSHGDNSSYPLIKVNINLTLTILANAKGFVLVIMEFCFTFSPSFKMTEQMKKIIDSISNWQRLVLSKGCGYAILIPTRFQEDNGEGLTSGIINLVNKGQPRKLDNCGTLHAWTWGAGRTLDYLETDKSDDSKK